MDKRTFLKNSAILGAGGILAGSIPGTIQAARTSAGIHSGEDHYKLPELAYPYDALEPHIDAVTMEIHHSMHHAGYTRKFNAAVISEGLEDKGIKEIFSKVSQQPDGIRNNGGGYYNHKIFWKGLSPRGGGEPAGDLLKAIEKNFGSFEKFREVFSAAAATRVGSGWAWLVKTDGGLAVTSTPNQGCSRSAGFPAAYHRCLGTCLLPEIPESQNRLHRGVLECGGLGLRDSAVQ